MALILATATRIRRVLPKTQLLLPTILDSARPLYYYSFKRPPHHFIQAFHQPLRTIWNNPPFSTLQSSNNQQLYEINCFSQYFRNNKLFSQPGINEFVEFLKGNANIIPSEGEAAMSFLDERGVKPNGDFAYSTIWALREEWKLAFLVFKWGQKWSCVDEDCWFLIIWVLGNHRKFNTAWCLIRDLHRASLDPQRAMLIMMDRYAAANDPGEAIKTFQLTERFKLSPDKKTFYTLLNILCKHGNMEEAEEFMFLKKKLFPLETEGFNILLNGWCNISIDVFKAKRIWREMARNCIVPNATTYTYMVSCFSKVGNLFDSLRLYDEMKKRGWIPGLKLYNSLIYVLSCENCLTEALKIVDKMKEVGVLPDSATYNSMILPLCKALKVKEARNILEIMVRENISPTIETYHAFLEGGVSLEATFEVLEHMRKNGLDPIRNTFCLIIDRFFKLKQPENALKIWEEMKQFEVVPDSEHYSIVVEGLAMCGSLVKARELYSEMRLNGIPDDPSLQKLLKDPGANRQKEAIMRTDTTRNVNRDAHIRNVRDSSTKNKNGKRPRRKIAS